MSTPNTRFWLTLVTLVEALSSFFLGVYFSVWGKNLSSPVWVWIMSVPGHNRTWGTLFLIFGALFLYGLQWKRVWPRLLGCTVTGLLYVLFGVILFAAPLVHVPNSWTGSTGMWFLGGFLTLCLAGFMRSEYRQDVKEVHQ